MVADKPMWIRFKYVKLPDFYYRCGKLGHVLKGCDTIQAEESNSNLQYGAWLRASLLKSHRLQADIEILEETKLFSSLHKSRSQPTVRIKLLFNNPPHAAATNCNDGLDILNSAAMTVNTAVPVIVGTETFKRKQDDILPREGTDRKIRVATMMTEPTSSSLNPAEVAEQPCPAS